MTDTHQVLLTIELNSQSADCKRNRKRYDNSNIISPPNDYLNHPSTKTSTSLVFMCFYSIFVIKIRYTQQQAACSVTLGMSGILIGKLTEHSISLKVKEEWEWGFRANTIGPSCFKLCP